MCVACMGIGRVFGFYGEEETVAAVVAVVAVARRAVKRTSSRHAH